MNKLFRITIIFLILYLSIGILVASIIVARRFSDAPLTDPSILPVNLSLFLAPLFFWLFWFIVIGAFGGYIGFALGGAFSICIVIFLFWLTKKIDKKLFKTEEEEYSKKQISPKTLAIIGAAIILLGIINIFLWATFSIFLIPSGIIIEVISILKWKKSLKKI